MGPVRSIGEREQSHPVSGESAALRLFTPINEGHNLAAGAYYSDAVAWASANSIVNGVTDTTFDPTANITREQLAAMLYRYAQFKGYDVSASEALTGYTDADSVSDYAVSAMQWAVGAGLVNGRTATTIAPQGTASRAEAAAMLMRFVENIAK